jgi:adenine-specific DNA methylase
MTALPPTYYLHVWWARRPLVASRAAILASLLPHDADHEKFMYVLGIHGDPVAGKKRIAEATRQGIRLGADAYGYTRAFKYLPNENDMRWINESIGGALPSVLDSTAGGGSIPFEASRLGFGVVANELNPVAWLILKATVEFPATLGRRLLKRVLLQFSCFENGLPEPETPKSPGV